MTQASSVKQPPPELVAQLQMALKFQKDSLFAEADNAYKKALKDYPGFPDALHLAAIFYEQIGKTKYAITLLSKIVKDKKADFKVYKLLGQSYLKEDNYAEALGHLKAATTLNPQDAETEYLIGLCFYRKASFGKALFCMEKALEKRESLPIHIQQDLFKKAAELFLRVGEYTKAKDLLEKAQKANLADYDILVRLAAAQGEGTPESIIMSINAIAFEPTRDEAKSLLSHCCLAGGTPHVSGNKIEPVMMSCFQSKNINHQTLGFLWGIDFFSAKNPEAMQLLGCIDYESFESKYKAYDKKVFLKPYFIESLKRIYAGKNDLERLYTHIRRFYLERIQNKIEVEHDELKLIGAMALQCHINDFVFSVTENEKSFIETLEKKMKNASSLAEEDIHQILNYACYKSLRSIERDSLLLSLSDHPLLSDVLKVHLKDPIEETKLADNIPSLSPINDKTSLAVQEQYEENPYPRWNCPSVIVPFGVSYIDREKQPIEEVLIAGCGTGQHIFNAMNRYLNPRITAVDLSKKSLGYAKRKLIEYGVDKKINLMQADILDLEKLGKTFDFIECGGVLHHMKEPEKGLKVLVKILKKGGILKLGLYSTLARKSVFEAREYIQQQGLPPTPEGIRKAREYLRSAQRADGDTYFLFFWRDFFSMSDCRDLIFHVQEHTFTIPQIKKLLEDNNLEFLGFESINNSLREFKKINTGENDAQDLDLWNQFELKNVQTFTGMYQFITVKK